MPMKINGDLSGAEIRAQFSEAIDEKHTFGLFAFNSNRLHGSNFDEMLDTLLGEIIGNLCDCSRTHKLGISFFIHPTVIDWEGSSGPAVCLYIGCNDDEYEDGCLYDELNINLRKMPSYVCAEGYSPEDSPFFGYYAPDNDTLHIAREFARTLINATGFTIECERSRS